MKVQDVMTSDVYFCSPEDSLARAAELMKTRDCGVVPVVNAENEVVGIITDRDAALFAASCDQTFSAIKVTEPMSRPVVSCRPADNLTEALKLMRRNKIKRLPVTSQKRGFVGIISIADIIAVASDDKSLGKKIIRTLTEINKPHAITLHELSEN